MRLLLIVLLTQLRPLSPALAGSLDGSKAGEARAVAGIQLRWCPAGSFKMGSPRDEPERRPGENQVEVTLSHRFWMGAYEVTQGDWIRVMGALPGGVAPDLSEVLGTPNDDGNLSRSRRGGAWTDPGWPQRSAFRQCFEPERRYEHIGMRVSVSLK